MPTRRLFGHAGRQHGAFAEELDRYPIECPADALENQSVTARRRSVYR